jgi:hypothetical protein
MRMEQLGSQRTDVHEIWYLKIFLKSVEKIHVSLESDKNNGYFNEYLSTFMIIFRLILLRMKMFQTKAREKIKTHILYSATCYRKSFRLWDTVEKDGTAR